MAALVSYRGDPLVDALFASTASARRNYSKEFSEGPIEVLPGHYSGDRPYLMFLDELSRLLTKEYPESVDDHGRVFGNGVRGPFWGLRHVPGFPMINATFPLADNRRRRAEAGLANEWVLPWHKTMFRALIRVLFANLEPVPLKWRNGSSTMSPFFQTTDEAKADIALRMLDRDARLAGELMMAGKHKEAFLQTTAGGAIMVVYRQQCSDKITYSDGVFSPKDRIVADLAYAASGGEAGHLSVANKSLEGSTLAWFPDGFFRTRARTAMGVNFSSNCCGMPIAQALRRRIYEDYPYTFHHTSREQKKSKIADRALVIMTDVSDHDILWPGHMFVPEIVDVVGELGYAEWWLALFENLFHQPIYVSTPGPEVGHALIGDWRKPSLNPGLTSGNAFTDLVGAMGMVFVYALMQIEHTAPHFVADMRSESTATLWWERYLKGKLEIAQASKSDDAMLVWSEGPLHAAGERLLVRLKEGDKKVSPYMLISYEHGGAFLGDILLYDMLKSLQTTEFIGNILSMTSNQFTPEYDIQRNIKERSKRKRPFPGLAWSTIKQVFSSSPIFGDVMGAIEFCWQRQFNESYYAYRDELLRQDTKALAEELARRSELQGLNKIDLTPIDLEVLAEPDKGEWKYLPSDINPTIHKLLFHGLDLDVVEPYFRSVIR